MKTIPKKLTEFLENVPAKIQTFFPSVFQQKKTELISSKIFPDYIDSSKSFEEKIKLEKRRRQQAYMTLDYVLNLTTYFDFLSHDVFEIFTNSKHYAQILKKKTVTSDILLFSCFSSASSSPSLEILNKFGITKDEIVRVLNETYFSTPKTNFEIYLASFTNFLENYFSFFSNSSTEISLNPLINYSVDVNRILEKSAQNSLKRFKSPVITTEILLITILEEEKNRASKLMRSFVKEEADWFLLRYQLMKLFYQNESAIRTEIEPNQQFFAYLLKIQLSDIEYQTLQKQKEFAHAVSIFRNQLIQETLTVDLYHLLDQDIAASIQANSSERVYLIDSE